MRFPTILLLILATCCLLRPSAQCESGASRKLSPVPLINIYTFIEEVTFEWSGSNKNVKVEGQKQVLFHDETGQLTDEFLKAVEAINEAFGYEKVIPQLSTKTNSDVGEILVYLADYPDVRSVLRKAGGRGGSFSNEWDGWLWYDDNDEVERGIIGLARERLAAETFSFHLIQSLFFTLGYQGYSSVFPNSIFGSYDARARKEAKDKGAPLPLITEIDKSVIRFCDVYLHAGAKERDLKDAISKEWPKYAARVDAKNLALEPTPAVRPNNPAPADPTPHADSPPMQIEERHEWLAIDQMGIPDSLKSAVAPLAEFRDRYESALERKTESAKARGDSDLANECIDELASFRDGGWPDGYAFNQELKVMEGTFIVHYGRLWLTDGQRLRSLPIEETKKEEKLNEVVIARSYWQMGYSPPPNAPDALAIYTWHLKAPLLRRMDHSGPGLRDPKRTTQDVLTDAGISFDREGSSAVYNVEKHTLTLRHSASMLIHCDELLKDYGLR